VKLRTENSKIQYKKIKSCKNISIMKNNKINRVAAQNAENKINNVEMKGGVN
jgi:hypothetical protein